MDVEDRLDFGDQDTQLEDEVPFEHAEPEDEELEAELSYLASVPLGPDILHDETTRLAAALASRDEGGRLEAIRDMRNAVTGKGGENMLVSYILASPQCAELMNIWLAGPASATAVPLMHLLYHMFKHSLGKDEGQREDIDGESSRRFMTVKLRLDKLARSIIRNRMKDIYAHLSSSQKSRQNAALLLLSAMVVRGRVLATEIATTFDFTLEALRKLSRPPPQQKSEHRKDMMLKRPTRFAFVDFAMSFLEVGDPGLLRWILQKRPLYAGVLHNISKDDENTMVKVLVLFQEMVMAPELMVPRGLQSVLFGDATLDQLARISADKSVQMAGEFAYDILVRLCTDPSHGLCPESTEIWGAPTSKTGSFGGGQARLLRLMNRLKVTEVDAHRDLLLAIGRARPKFAAAYIAAIPFSLEPRVSPAWFRAMSVVSMLIPLASQPPPFASLARQGIMAPAHDGSLIRGVLLSLLPPALSRLTLNRGLQHADILVKHACLRVFYEALVSLRRLLEAVDAAAACSETVPVSSEMSGTFQQVNIRAERNSDGEYRQMSWPSLSQCIQDTMRARLPDPNILYGMLRSPKTSSSAGNGTVTSSPEEGIPELTKKRKRTDSNMGDESEELRVSSGYKPDYESTILELWGPEAVTDAGRREDAEVLIHSKVLEVLVAFQRVLPIALADTGFDAFKLLPDNPVFMPIVQQNAVTALLLAVSGCSATSSSDKLRRVGGEFVGVGSAYKRLKPLLLLMLSTPSKNVSEEAYRIIQKIMFNIGAFDTNPGEIRLWLDALIGWKTHRGHELRSTGERRETCFRSNLSPGTIHATLVDFLAEAVGSLSQNIYRYLDRLHQNLSKFTLESAVDDVRSPDMGKGGYVAEFGPFVICTLDTCLRTMRSESKTTYQRAAVATYVVDVLHMLLNYQVHPQALASVLRAELSTETATATLKTFVWSSLQTLLQRSEEFLPSTKIAEVSGSSRSAGVCQAQNSEAGKLQGALTSCKKDRKVARETKLEALRSLLLCIPVEELLDKFPLLMEVGSDVFDGDSSTLVALLGVHQNLLTDISRTWPELFSLALELAGTVRDRDGETVTSDDLKSSALMAVDSRVVSEAVGLCALFLNCPFSVLFSAAVHGKSGILLMSSAFTKILQAAARKVPSSSWLCAVRLIVSGMKQLFAVSPHGGSPLDTCFTLLCGFSSPTRLESVDGNFAPLAVDGGAIMEDYRLMILDLLNHPALYDIFLCSKSLSNSRCPFVSDLRRDNKNEKICETTLKRVLATAASEVNAFDGHILVLLTRLLESTQTLHERALSPSLVNKVCILQKEIFEACGSFVRKTLAVLRKEVEESPGVGVVATPSLFAASVLIPYSDLFSTTDFLLFLLPAGRSKIRKRGPGVARHVLGLHLTTVFIDSLAVAAKRHNVLVQLSGESKCEEQSSKGSESQRIFDLYERVVDQVLSNTSMLADLCLLSFLQAFDPKLAISQNSKEQYRGLDKTRFADLARCTPLALPRHCLMHLNKVTGSIVTLLAESSSVHLSELGWLFARSTAQISQKSFTGCQVSFGDKMLVSGGKTKKLGLTISEHDLFKFWPAAKLYLEVKLAEGSCEDKEVVHHMAEVYGTYLEKQVSSWDEFLSAESVNAWYESAQLPYAYHDAPGKILEYCHDSPAGQVVQMLRLCHSFHALSNESLNRMFRSVLPDESTISLDGSAVADEDICRVVSEVVAKVDILRYLIDSGLKLESVDLEDREEVSEKTGDQVLASNVETRKNSTAAQRFLRYLVYSLCTVYKSGGIDWKKETAGSPCQAELGRTHWLLFLEEMLLAQVTHTAEELLEVSVDLPSFFAVYKYSLAMLLGYRYGEPAAMKAVRYLSILFLRCIEEDKDFSGQTVYFNALELLISHSKFLSSMLARDSRSMEIPYLSGRHVGKGTSLNSLTSVLLLIGSPLVDHLGGRVQDINEASAEHPASVDFDVGIPSRNSSKDDGSQKKSELVKLLRILVTLRLRQRNRDMTNSEPPPLEQLLSVLLAAYGGTMSELDQEIFALMHEIESHGGPGFPGLSGLDYIWGEAALKRRKRKSSEVVSSKTRPEEPDNSVELRKQTFREDLLIDPQRCGLTVLFFPARRQMPVPKIGHFLSAKQFKDCPQEHRARVVGAVEKELRAAAYDPAFILPFAVHGLSIGCISAEDFVRLGLLAVAFASLSSADETMRKSGYEVLAKCYALLESGPSFKCRTQIRLLMTHVKNSVGEAWQKLPLVLSIFAAEASCVLMKPENHHYLSINRFLLRAPSLDMESIPLFQIMFGSGSVQYRSDRLWMLRLLAAGLGSSLDAHIYRRKFVLELLMSFHDSAMADPFTRKWVLQILYRAVLVRSSAKYLVEHTGLLSWLASVAINDCESNSGLHENDGAGALASVSLKVIESILSWGVVQSHLLTDGWEELSKVALMFHRFLVRNLTSHFRKIFARPTVHIMTLVLRMSHRRRKHQTHFSLNIVGVEEVLKWFEGGITGTGSLGRLEERINCLKMILQCSPPPVFSLRDKVRLHNIATWGIQVAMQAELEAVPSTSVADENFPQRRTSGTEESICLKLQRWLAAALVLGDISRVTDHREQFTDCLRVVSFFRTSQCTASDVNTSIDEKLARLLLSLQGRVKSHAEVSSLVTVVAALARLTPFAGFSGGDGGSRESGEKIRSVLELLLSELPCPEEVSPSWRWYFGGPWTSHSTRQDEHEAAQASYVSEVCASSFTFLQLLWSKRHQSFSSYLDDLETHLSENQFFSSGADDDSSRVQVVKKLQLLQEKFCHALQTKPPQAPGFNKNK